MVELKIINIDGYKTYIMAGALICWALGGMVAGKVPISVGVAELIAALGIASLRNSIFKPKE